MATDDRPASTAPACPECSEPMLATDEVEYKGEWWFCANNHRAVFECHASTAPAEAIVNEQAEDDGLWFTPQTAPEAYLQEALRRLHEAVEGKGQLECAIDAVVGTAPADELPDWKPQPGITSYGPDRSEPPGDLERALDERQEKALVRLKNFVRAHNRGGCKMLSKGDECDCALCDIDYLRRLFDVVQQDVTQLKETGKSLLRREKKMQDEATTLGHELQFQHGETEHLRKRIARLERERDLALEHLKLCERHFDNLADATAGDIPESEVREMLEPERLARWFHEAYEELAPSMDYETREESAVPWDGVPETNKRLMIATATGVRDRILADRKGDEQDA